PTLLSYLGIALVSGLVALAVVRRPAAWPIAASIAFIAGVAVGLRLEALASSVSAPLDPDAINYRVFAERFDWWPPWTNGLFSANFGEREPLYPMLLHSYFALFGASDFHVRAVSTILSVVALVTTMVAARRWVSWV